jgi:iron complex transport system permease protein
MIRADECPIAPSDVARAVRVELEEFVEASAAKKASAIAISLVILFALVLYSVAVGTANLSVAKILGVLAAGPAAAERDSLIIWQLRLPRVMLGLVGGAGLALAGVTMQGITRNPLVSPFTIGISPAAAFGASMVILFRLGSGGILGRYAVVLGAFASALLCAAIVLSIASARGATVTIIILAGTALTYLFSALTATLQYFASEQALASIVNWTFGTLNGASWDEVAIIASFLAVSMPLLLRYSWGYNALATGGDDSAASLGFDVRRIRIVSSLISVVITAAVVSFTGVIGFIGLVAPHIARMIIGGDHRYLLPFSALVGAILLILADTLGRVLFAPVVLPVGIMISYVGVPLFVNLILKSRKQFL